MVTNCDYQFHEEIDMYAQAAIKPNTLLRNGAYGIVMRAVQNKGADHRSGSQPYFHACEQDFYILRAFSNFARTFAQNPSFAKLYQFSVDRKSVV